MRIDTTTTTHAIQIKHKRDPMGTFAPSDVCGSSGSVRGEAYLLELKGQSQQLMLIPILVTNRPAGPALQALLTQHSIHHYVDQNSP